MEQTTTATPLPRELSKYGYKLTQIDRQNNIAIYTQQDENKIIAYEVIIIKTSKRDKGKVKEGDELYPNSETWGWLGWTFKTLNSAYKKFNELL